MSTTDKLNYVKSILHESIRLADVKQEMRSALDWLTDPNVKPRRSENDVVEWIKAIQKDAADCATNYSKPTAEALLLAIEALELAVGPEYMPDCAAEKVCFDALFALLAKFPDPQV